MAQPLPPPPGPGPDDRAEHGFNTRLLALVGSALVLLVVVFALLRNVWPEMASALQPTATPPAPTSAPTQPPLRP